GAPGRVVVINMQGARGIDYLMSTVANSLGGGIVRITGVAATATIVQALNRVARSGLPGSAVIYTSAEARAVVQAHNPNVFLGTIMFQHAGRQAAASPGSAAARDAFRQAERRFVSIVPLVQQEADKLIGVFAPASDSAVRLTFTDASAPDQSEA